MSETERWWVYPAARLREALRRIRDRDCFPDSPETLAEKALGDTPDEIVADLDEALDDDAAATFDRALGDTPDKKGPVYDGVASTPKSARRHPR
jgi:hypothetical protein